MCSVRVMTYNAHSCIGTDGVRSEERIAEVIAASGAEVIALQELDHCRPRSQCVHQAEVIAAKLGMQVHFHPALRVAEEEYGEAILSSHPLRLVRAGILPGVPPRWCPETRGALWIEVKVSGVTWQIINTHLGLGRGERLQQAHALLGPEWIGSREMRAPWVLCGDFNSPAIGRVRRLLAGRTRDVQRGRHLATFPSRFPLLALDHFFVSSGVLVKSIQVARTPLTRLASDHLPLTAELAWENPLEASPSRAGWKSNAP